MEKLICVDLDGTILPHEMIIKPEVLKVLHGTEYKFLIATGRASNEVKSFGIDIDHIGSNGAEIIKDGKLYDRLTIEKQVAIELVEKLICEVGNAIITTTAGRYIYEYTDFEKMANDIILATVGSLDQTEIDRVLPKLKVCDDYYQKPADVLNIEEIEVIKIEAATYEKLDEMLSSINQIDGLSSFSSVGGYIEIVPEGVNKAKAIEKYIGNNEYQIIAIGDGDNDIEMFELADVSFAMKNGTNNIKEIATHITDSIDEDGFIKAIEYIRENY